MRISSRLSSAASPVPGIGRPFLKVFNLNGSNRRTRALVAVSLACALTAAGAVPLIAAAQEVPLAVTPLVSVDATLTAAMTTATPVMSLATTPVVAVKRTAAVVKKLTVRQIVAKVGRDAGLSKRSVAALLWIAKRESNFHPTSVSSSGCHGLFQLSTGMAHGHPWKNPAWNTKRAIKYMKGRYGSVLRAQAFWSSHHWY
jgi:hypothetical protein